MGHTTPKPAARKRQITLPTLILILGILTHALSKEAMDVPTTGLSSDPPRGDDGSNDFGFKLFKVHTFNVDDLDEENKNMHLQSPDHIFRLSLRPGHKVISKLQTYNMKPPGIAADWPVATSIVNAFCEKKRTGDSCEVQMDITDTLLLQTVKFRQTAQQHQLRVEYFDYNKYYFIFENKLSEEVIVTFSNICPKCGSEKHRPNKFAKNADVKKKVATLNQIMATLNHLSLLGVKSKAMVHQFARNMTTAEFRLLKVAIVEGVVLFLVAVWQIWKIRRLILKQLAL